MATRTVLSDTLKNLASTSVELAMKSTPSNASIVTPQAVRTGRLLGRSSRLWISLSFVNLRSSIGQTKTRLKIRPGRITAGTKTSNGMVWPQLWNDHDGHIRSAPSRNPMYQSGWTAYEMRAASYGPNCQIGFTYATAPSSAVMPPTMNKKPVVLAMKTGNIGEPTTFFSVRPPPGN